MSERSALNATLAAVVAALNVPSMLALATAGVFGAVPQGTRGRYLQVGPATEVPLDCMQKSGKNLLVQVHAFDTDAPDSVKGVGDMVSQAVALLNYQPLSVEGHNTIGCQFDSTVDAGSQMDEGLGREHHLVASFRVQLEQSA